MYMCPPPLVVLLDQGQLPLWKEPLMDKLLRRLRELPLSRVIEKYPIVFIRQILFVKCRNTLHLLVQFISDRLRQRHGPVLLSLAMHRQNTCVKIGLNLIAVLHHNQLVPPIEVKCHHGTLSHFTLAVTAVVQCNVAGLE